MMSPDKPGEKGYAALCPQCGAALPEVAGRIWCPRCGSTVMLQGREPPPDMTTYIPPKSSALDFNPLYYIGLGIILTVILLPVVGLLITAVGPRFADSLDEPTPTEVKHLPGMPWTVTVSARHGWQETGVDVQAGQTVSITYLHGTSGVWGGPEGVKRQTDVAGFEEEYRDTAPFPDAPLGALIGRVGNGSPFFVGNGLTFTVEKDGPLQL